MIRWEQAYKSGIAMLDTENERILSFVTFVKSTNYGNHKKLAARDFLENTYKILRKHFEYEEEIIFTTDIRGVDGHISDHSLILNEFRSVIDEANTDISANDALEYISSAMAKHFEHHDINLIHAIQGKREAATRVQGGATE